MEPLTEEQKKQIYDAGCIEADIEQLAKMLNTDDSSVFIMMDDPNCELRSIYQKGKSDRRNEILKSLSEKAKEGDRFAAKELSKQIDEMELRDMIRDFIGTKI